MRALVLGEMRSKSGELCVCEESKDGWGEMIC